MCLCSAKLLPQKARKQTWKNLTDLLCYSEKRFNTLKLNLKL